MTRQDKIELLIKTMSEMRRSSRSSFKFALNITKAQGDIMFEINNGCTRTADLANMMQTTPSAVTQLINQLVELGYVKRVDSSVDRREVQLHLTVRGKKLLEQFHAHMRAKAADIASVLSDEELDQFINIAKKIASANNLENK